MKNDPSQLIFNFSVKAECEMAAKRSIFKQTSPKKYSKVTFRDPLHRRSKNTDCTHKHD